MLHAIELTEFDRDGTLLELKGDLDLFSLRELRATLDLVASLRRPALVDLSGITFLDVGSARELAVYSCLYGHHVTFVKPSWQVLASIGACGLRDKVRFGPITDLPAPEVFPELPDSA